MARSRGAAYEKQHTLDGSHHQAVKTYVELVYPGPVAPEVTRAVVKRLEGMTSGEADAEMRRGIPAVLDETELEGITG